MASSGKFLIVVPLVVVAALDALKQGNQRIHRGARDAIRTLQEAMQASRPLLRAQTENERAPLSSAGPRAAGEVAAFLECCRYFVMKGHGHRGVVTVLTADPVLTQLVRSRRIGRLWFRGGGDVRECVGDVKVEM